MEAHATKSILKNYEREGFTNVGKPEYPNKFSKIKRKKLRSGGKKLFEMMRRRNKGIFKKTF